MVDSDGQLDEAAGTLPLMDPEVMFKMHFQSFIDSYGLSATVDEIIAQVGEVCAAGTIEGVSDCIRCHYINTTTLSDDDKWEVFNDVGPYAECFSDSDIGGMY